MERIDQALIRELEEELGVEVEEDDVQFLVITNDIQDEGAMHYVHITFSVDIKDQQPKLVEPEYCEAWEWFWLHKLPENIFPPHIKVLQTINSKQPYIFKG